MKIIQKMINYNFYDKFYDKINKKYYLLFVLSLLTIIFALSLIYDVFSYIFLVIGVLFCFTLRNSDKLYFVCAISTFSNVLRCNNEQISFYFYFLCVLMFFWGFNYLFELLLKNKKIEFKTLIPIVLLCIYALLPLGKQSWNKAILISMTLALIYLAYIYRTSINFKKLIMCFIAGILIGSIFAVFFPVFEKVLKFGFNFSGPTDNTIRFAGLYTDPNFYASWIAIALCGLFLLKIRNQIGWSFYIYLFLTLSFLFMTMSKMAYLILLLSVCAFLFFIIIKRNKTKTKRLICVALTVVCLFGSVLSVGKYVNSTINRFGSLSNVISLKYDLSDYLDSYYKKYFDENPTQSLIVLSGNPTLSDEQVVQIEDKEELENITLKDPDLVVYTDFARSFLNSSIGKFLTKITTFRFTIWMGYYSFFVQNIDALVFGVGEGSPFIKILLNKTPSIIESHSSILELLYYYGLLFIIIIVFMIIIMLKTITNKRMNFCIENLLPVFVLLCCLFSINLSFSYQVAYLILISSFAIFSKDKPTQTVKF